MTHIKVTFVIEGDTSGDMLIALLADSGYDGFEETGDALLAYISEEQFDASELKRLAGLAGAPYTTEVIPAQNWNALWESNFQPVIVDGICTIRASFHDIPVATPYDIRITPKMSFGTGHHATTRQMIIAMHGMKLKGKQILDFGTGTGVLAVFASMMGAAHVVAIDNDEWSVENALENVANNGCGNIAVHQGSLEDIAADKYDVILANINRHILLHYMNDLVARLKTGGTILMSGLLTNDREIIAEAATGAGLQVVSMSELNDWIAILFDKK